MVRFGKDIGNMHELGAMQNALAEATGAGAPGLAQQLGVGRGIILHADGVVIFAVEGGQGAAGGAAQFDGFLQDQIAHWFGIAAGAVDPSQNVHQRGFARQRRVAFGGDCGEAGHVK